MRIRITLLGLFLSFCLGWSAPISGTPLNEPEATTLFLVRHAEKANDGTYDPPLTPEGTARAAELAYLLGHLPLDAVYATPFKRTLLTVEPVAEAKGLKVEYYKPDDKTFLQKALDAHSGGTILICGHSNTIPGLANQLAGGAEYNQLEDATYDNLFIAVLERGLGQARLIRIRFGAHTPEK
jgi:2,3-bisphosphoglycerate-dependent phosphoglycerate mutase